MNLVVGATGALGGEICRLLVESGGRVRALVRSSSSPERVEALRSLGIEIAAGDLRDKPSLDRACESVTAVLSTATTIVSRQGGDSFTATDRDGQIALIEAAEAAGCRRFLYVSLIEVDAEVPLQDAKRAVERRLQAGSLTYTILRPGLLMETWLSPIVGFDAQNGAAHVSGSGEKPLNWIAVRDVARVAVAALDTPAAENAVIELGGDYLSPLEVIRIFEETTGKRFIVEHVPEEAVRASVEGAADEVQKTFAGISHANARGHTRDATAAPRELGIDPTTVRTFASQHVG